ncbi:MAG TPA: EAL domain-containing protein [Pseudolabrys sp.]|nr:EAL domain-containing protein [Pseudolabrys sp.]
MTNFKKLYQPFARHSSVLFGAILISLVWITLFFFLKNEHDSAERGAIQNSTNLAGALEEHLSRSLSEIDRSLKTIRTLYAREPGKFDLVNWLKSTQILHNDIFQISISDRDGNVKFSSIESTLRTGANVKDADFYRAHVTTQADTLFISNPRFGQPSGKWSIQLSRRIENSYGAFNGVVVAYLDPAYLTRIYNSVNIGDEGYIRVIGADGIVRATSGRSLSLLGKDFSGADLFKFLSKSPAGWYYTGSGLSDNVQRLIAYRSVNDYPLIITVGVPSPVIFSRLETQKQSGYLIAAVLTLLIVIVTGFSVRGQYLRDRAKKHLEHANMLLNATLANMPHGICMFGPDKRLVLANDLYSTMYRLDPKNVKPGTTLSAILEARIASGCCPADAQKYVKDRIEEAFLADPGYIINNLRDGRTFAVSRRAMPGGGSVAVHQDITAHLQAERELKETKQFLNSIVELIPIAVVVKDAVTRKFVLVNRAFEAMLKIPRSEVLGKTVFDIYRAKDAERIDASDDDALAGEFGIYPSDYELEMPGGESRILATSRIVVRDAHGEAKHLIVVIDDITERKRSEQRIAFMAHHDVLTGLANRLAIMEKIEEAIARNRRRGDPFSVLLLDLDRFKHVNDTLGHAVGDALLRETAVRLKESLRETDVLARLGGDEFAIVQDRDADQRDAASALAERIIEIISRPFIIDNNEVNIATSIGIALAPEHANNSDSLMKMADLALYRAKSAGRNTYRFFDPEMSLAASARHELENELRRAIQQDELELHYQPIVDTKTRLICGAEALMRWRHPTKGIILPDQFIPLAEETGMITQLGEWLLQTACADAASWPLPIKVAVNLSAVQFRKNNLVDIVMCALAQSDLPPERLELEITETALIESATECLPVLRQFKNLGIAVVLDDFGTGYSSLSQLMMFPFDKIKVDRSFTQNLTKRTECAAIIAATLTLARSLDIATTAEGVETPEQYRLLRVAGVTSLQGYLFQAPCPSSQIDFSSRYNIPEVENAA